MVLPLRCGVPLSSPLKSGWACDSFAQWSLEKVMCLWLLRLAHEGSSPYSLGSSCLEAWATSQERPQFEIFCHGSPNKLSTLLQSYFGVVTCFFGLFPSNILLWKTLNIQKSRRRCEHPGTYLPHSTINIRLCLLHYMTINFSILLSN